MSERRATVPTMAARRNKKWDESYADLIAYHKKYGHCNVPQRDRKYKDLGLWVSMQRQRKAACGNSRRPYYPLSQDQIDRLNDIGFVWVTDRFETQWEDKFEKLKRYKKLHGDCLVPKVYDEDPSLGHWVGNQRMIYKRGTIRKDRKEKLAKLGFSWCGDPRHNWSRDRDTTTTDSRWEDMYNRLVDFREQNGHCMVPNFIGRVNYQALGRWVRQQRTSFAEGWIYDERKKLLDKLGFVWKIDATDTDRSLTQRQWDAMFDKLVKFKETHGHCLVKVTQKDGVLGRWVNTQRRSRKRMDLSRLERLNSIGFCWKPKEDPRLSGISKNESASSKRTESELADAADFVQKVEIGSRVSVYWPDGDEYYDATVTRQRNKKKPFFLKYDDGDGEWVDLGQHKFRLLPARGKRSRRDLDTAEKQEYEHEDETRKHNKRRRFYEAKSAESANLQASLGYESHREWSNGHDEESGASFESDNSESSVDTDGESEYAWSDDNDSADSATVIRLDKQGHSERRESDVANVKIGSRVSVYWPDDDRYYAATVTRFKQIKRKPHFIEYDDGDHEWIDLSQHRFRLLSAIESDDESSVQGIFSSSRAQQHSEYDESARRVVSPTEHLSSKRTKACRIKKQNQLSDCESELEWTDEECVEPVSEDSGGLAKKVDRLKDGDGVMEPINDTGTEYGSVDVNTKNELHQQKERAEATKESILKYPIGARVRKFFGSLGWFNGKVTSFGGGHYMVIFEGGDTEEYSDNEMAGIVLTPELAQVEVGSRVAVFWPEDKTFYNATVTRERNKKKPLFLEYDDGDREWIDLRHHKFRLLPERTRRRTEIMADSETEDDSGVESSSDEEEFGD